MSSSTEKKFAWEDEFLSAVPTFEKAGMPAERARHLLETYLRISHDMHLPPILDFEHHPELLSTASPFLEPDPEIHELMNAIFEPLLSRFALRGSANFARALPWFEKTGVTIVSNHLSLFDATVTYELLRRNADFKPFAEKFFFITGRLVFTSEFSRVAGRGFRTMLVASPRDMAENESIRRELTRLNLRSYKEAKERQKKGEALILYPEGTRSRNGVMLPFHGPLFNYLEGTIVLPVAVQGPDKILHADSLQFGFAEGSMEIAEPVYVGSKISAPEGIRLFDPDDYPKETRKQETLDMLGRAVAAMLPKAMRGHYG